MLGKKMWKYCLSLHQQNTHQVCLRSSWQDSGRSSGPFRCPHCSCLQSWEACQISGTISPFHPFWCPYQYRLCGNVASICHNRMQRWSWFDPFWWIYMHSWLSWLGSASGGPHPPSITLAIPSSADTLSQSQSLSLSRMSQMRLSHRIALPSTCHFMARKLQQEIWASFPGWTFQPVLRIR